MIQEIETDEKIDNADERDEGTGRAAGTSMSGRDEEIEGERTGILTSPDPWQNPWDKTSEGKEK